MSDIIVSVIMTSYNHEAHIAQAIEGVLMQQTSFGFELIIGDDCSTDNTADIISEYQRQHPYIIKAFLNKFNIGSIGNEIKLLSKVQGRYISFCEGDDFWTDPEKLQKQIDFLEINPDYGLVHADVNHLNNKTGKIIYAHNNTNGVTIPSGNIFDYLMNPRHNIKTMTVCLRRDLFESFYLHDPDILTKEWRLLDISIWLMIAKYSKIHYCDEVFATYRLSEESASRSKNLLRLHQFHLSVYDVYFYFAEKYACNDLIKDNLKLKYYKMLLSDAYMINNKKMSRSAFKNLKSLRYQLSLKEKVKFLLTGLTKR
jgi:glycosyltransferase involved in cell wall biosynthesis